jgi:hypothetical protein
VRSVCRACTRLFITGHSLVIRESIRIGIQGMPAVSAAAGMQDLKMMKSSPLSNGFLERQVAVLFGAAESFLMLINNCFTGSARILVSPAGWKQYAANFR